jgi:hypothetical protein
MIRAKLWAILTQQAQSVIRGPSPALRSAAGLVVVAADPRDTAERAKNHAGIGTSPTSFGTL